MHLAPSPEQQQLVDAFAALLGKHASPEQVRAAEPGGFDERLWGQLLETGAVAMAVDEASGGWGASLLELALVAEQLGRHVAPAPVIDVQVAARLLARLGTPVAAQTLTDVLAGEAIVTVAVRPAVAGLATMVPAAAVADAAVVLDGDRLVLVPLGGRPSSDGATGTEGQTDAAERTPVENLGSMPVADVVLPADAAVLAEGEAAAAAFDAALDDWLALTAAALVGIGARGLEIGVDYVKERHAWGVPIGSFQAISHRLADSAAAVDGARLLAQEAAWAPLGAPGRHPELAALAFGTAYEAARDATHRSLHFHGGYGFMMEYDIQLLWRRARAWALVWGDGPAAYRRAADKRWADPSTKPAGEGAPQDGLDFTMSGAGEAMRAEVRGFIEDFMTPEREEHLYRTGVSHDPEFTQGLVDRQWLGARWPAELRPEGYGRMWSIAEVAAMFEEFGRADAPTYAPNVTTMIAKVIAEVGPDEMKADIVPKALHGEVIMSLGFSEPEAGSDVANAQCKAVRDGDEWVINGQKMFTTNAHIADYAFTLTRTNPDVAKHKGLTMFLVPLKHEGVEIQAVYTLSGERTNIVFFTDVRVPDSARIGEVDGGWRVMTGALQDEHSNGFGARIMRVLEDVEAWAADAVDAEGTPRLDDPDLRGRIARVAAELEVSLLLQRRANWMAEEGIVPEAEGPMAKLYSSEAMERATQDLVEAIGPDALRSYFEPTAPVHGRLEHALRFSLGTTIYAGTSEVQRNIIAQRGLGLPR